MSRGSTRLPDMAVRWGPDTRSCSFVFAHGTCKPSGVAVVQKLDRISMGYWSWGRNKAVLSACTRSVKLLRPTSVPRRVDVFNNPVYGNAEESRCEDRIHPCLTLNVVWNLPESCWPTLTQVPVDSCWAAMQSSRIGEIPLLSNVFHRSIQSTESNADIISKKATSNGRSNFLCSLLNCSNDCLCTGAVCTSQFQLSVCPMSSACWEGRPNISEQESSAASRDNWHYADMSPGLLHVCMH